jgi:uncharacterized protein
MFCRFHVSSLVRYRRQALYEWIAETAHRQGLRDAIVMRGLFGLEPDGRVISTPLWKLRQELPVTVEVVDESKRIESLVRFVEPQFHAGVIAWGHTSMSRRGDARDQRFHMPLDEAFAHLVNREVTGVRTMKPPHEGVLVRIFINESDRETGSRQPLYRAIVQRARQMELASATVIRASGGYGAHNRRRVDTFLELAFDLPIVVEITDVDDKIRAFLPIIDELVTQGSVTMHPVTFVHYN